MSDAVGIRREDKSPWERRVPLVPQDVARLRRAGGLRFLVEPSAKRIYSDEAYREAGAELEPDLGAAKVILAVKEIPLEKLLANKVYAFFAHVIKGQSYNMPLLGRLLELGCTLVEYERIVDESGRRLVLFGREAGQAGMIDALWALGERLARAGHETPLMELRPAHGYEDSDAAAAVISDVGWRLQQHLARHPEIPGGPLVFAFTGAGNVSRGAQEIFDLLPHEEVDAEDLAELGTSGRGAGGRLVKVRLGKEHLAAPKEPGRTFDPDEFRNHPERFRARLPELLPYVTVLVNGIYWTPRYPRYLTRAAACEMWRRGERKLVLIADISCDVDGAIELTHKATQPDEPAYVYHPESDSWSDGLDGEGIAILAVDNLPAELPRDASNHFSRSLRGFVPALARADYERPYDELDLPPEIHRAVVTHRGELTPPYRYLARHLERRQAV